MIPIDYYITPNSPWTYLGAAAFKQLAAQYGATVKVKPADFGEVFSKTGGLPLPKRSDERKAYRMMELKRWRTFLNIPIVLEPAHFGTNTRPASEAICAAQAAGLNALGLSLEVGRACWEREEDLAETSVIDAAAQRAGIDLDAFHAARGEHDGAALFAANTAEALAHGVFGAPAYVFEDGAEWFWGQDRLDFVEQKLQVLSGRLTKG
ncbi:MAG: 2-hydroxychromene-2-carboxylate isomerase [Pseudomonadota bacterium]